MLFSHFDTDISSIYSLELVLYSNTTDRIPCPDVPSDNYGIVSTLYAFVVRYVYIEEVFMEVNVIKEGDTSEKMGASQTADNET